MKPTDGEQQRLQIISRFPDDEATEVDAKAPFVVEFNHALDPQTVAGALKLRVGGKEVASRQEVQGERLFVFLEEVPPLPATVSVSLSAQLSGSRGEAFAGATWSFSLPVWQQTQAQDPSADSASFARTTEFSLLSAASGEKLMLSEERDGESRAIPAPSERSADAYTVLSSGAWDDSKVALLWTEAEGANTAVYSAVWDGEEWASDPQPVVEGAGLHAATAHSEERLVVASYAAGNVEVALKQGSEDFASFGDSLSVGELGAGELAVALDGEGGVLLAVVTAEGAVDVYSSTGTAWVRLGGVSREARDLSAQPSVLAMAGKIHLAFQDGDSVSSHAYVASWDGDSFVTAPALDLELDAQASFPRLQQGANSPFVAWLEEYGEQRRVFVAELTASGWRILAREALGSLDGAVQALRLGVDTLKRPLVAVASSEGAFSAALNDVEALPPALSGRGARGACVIPEDGAGFPQTLAATGCYLDLKARRMVAAALPYNINSPLWSDGATKARYILLPDGETMTYEETSAWGMPVGTVIIKEFLFEKETGNPETLFPVETRFLVKRCEEEKCVEPWQGYSYRWNTDATDGELLTNTNTSEEVEWSVTTEGQAARRTHIYPGRTQCMECHTASVGRVLGVDTPQLARSQDYGDYVGSQLETFFELGLFGESVDAAGLAEVKRLPSPADVSRTLEQRSRAYFESNCAHCHHPDGIRPTIDFRYFGAGLIPDPDGAGALTGNICDWLVPGDSASSEIYIRDQIRNTEAVPAPIQMPPIATNISDDRQLDITSRFITELLTTQKCDSP